MGQFFRGTAPLATRNQIYQPNFELMGKVLGVVEGQIEKGEQELQAIDKLLKDIKYLDQDKNRVKDIIDVYNKKNEEYTNLVANNPLEFRKHLGNIKALGKQLANDYTSGELGAIQENKKARDEYVKEQKKRIAQKDSGLTEDYLNLMLNYQDKNFKGTNYKDKSSYEKYNGETLIADPNIIKLADEIAKGYKADSRKLHNVKQQGGYFVSGVQYEKGISPLVLSEFVTNSLLSDSKAQNYLKQYQKITGLSNKDISNIITNASLLAGQKYGFVEQEAGIKNITADSYSLKHYEHRLKEKQDLFTSVNIPFKADDFGDTLNHHLERARINRLDEIRKKLNIEDKLDFTKQEDVNEMKAILLAQKEKAKNNSNKIKEYEQLVLLETAFNKIEDDYNSKLLTASHSEYLNFTNNDYKKANMLEKRVKQISNGDVQNNKMRIIINTSGVGENTITYTLGQLLNNEIEIDGMKVRLEGVKGNMSNLLPVIGTTTTGDGYLHSSLRFTLVDKVKNKKGSRILYGKDDVYMEKQILIPMSDIYFDVFEDGTMYNN